jgi:phosphohistidine phosphatase
VVFLVHHGEAAGAEVDPQRPLTAAGRMHVDRLAHVAAQRGVKPAVIWHSGKLRARQTAEAFLRACNPLAEYSAIRGLQPDDPPTWIAEVVQNDARDVMLVGHMPHLPRLLTWLVAGGDTPLLDFPLHGLVALQPSSGKFEERWRISNV